MQERSAPKRKPQDQIQGTSEKKASTKHFPLNSLPTDLLSKISRDYLLGRETASLMINKNLHKIFLPLVREKVAAACAINPTKENVAKLHALLTTHPELLLKTMTVTNRHNMKIKGTVYQIALHEGDNELIDDVIKEGFKKLKNGEAIMEGQRKTWLPEEKDEKDQNWLQTEERHCKTASDAIDNVFAVFKKAHDPRDVTELQQDPWPITIHNPEAKNALDDCRKAIDDLYTPQDKVIESGRDPSILLFKQIIDKYHENYAALGGLDSPRNNAVMRSLYGYLQRYTPVNFMQAFTQGIHYIVENKEMSARSLAYQYGGGSILPLSTRPGVGLGYDYFGYGGGSGRVQGANETTKLFFNQKQQLHYNLALCHTQPKIPCSLNQ